jgi:hypothetical protein
MFEFHDRRLLTEPEAAKYLTLAPGTLRYHRERKTGPAYIQVGPNRIAYLVADLNEWANARRVVGGQAPLDPTAVPRAPVGKYRGGAKNSVDIAA